MGKRIALIQSNPDSRPDRFGRALARAYAEGANQGGHEVRTIDVAHLDFPLLRSKEEWESAPVPGVLRDSQTVIAWSEHIVFFFPLWLGTMPALLKAFLEQVLRPGFAIGKAESGMLWKKRLSGKSARIVVTMGMPALLYRWYFRAHGLKGLERNVLAFCGIGPVRQSLIGMVESPKSRAREKWLFKMRELGRRCL